MSELKSIKDLEKRIVAIKKEITSLGEMRPGSLSEQYNVCGKAACKCKDPKAPEKHGPYYQLSYSHNRKSTSEFVLREDLEAVRNQLADYKTFMKLKDEWIEHSILLAKLKKASR